MSVKNNRSLLTTMAIPLIGGSFAGFLATRRARKTYKKLEKPKFSPPGWVFPIMWTTLYTTMGIAKYVFDQKEKSSALQKKGDIAYDSQLALNFLWSFLFFKWRLRGTAFVEASMLWSAIVVSTYYFTQKSKVASSLMIPYVLWVSFALILNYKTWIQNKNS